MRPLLTGLILMALVAPLTGGCAGRAELWPNGDPTLRKTAAEFAADAAKRFPYKADAPRGGQALAAAEASYFLDRIDITNLSSVAWTDVEVWINGGYVVYLTQLEPHMLKSIPFQSIYNDKGQSLPTHQGSWIKQQPLMITKVELYRDGKLYDVPVQAAE